MLFVAIVIMSYKTIDQVIMRLLIGAICAVEPNEIPKKKNDTNEINKQCYVHRAKSGHRVYSEPEYTIRTEQNSQLFRMPVDWR